MDYYSKVTLSHKPLSKSKYFTCKSKYQEYVRANTHLRVSSEPKSKKKNDLNTSFEILKTVYESSIDPLPSLSKTSKRYVGKRNLPGVNEGQKVSWQGMRKLYSPTEVRPQVSLKGAKKETEVIELQKFLKEFHKKSKMLLSRLEEDFKKNCLD